MDGKSSSDGLYRLKGRLIRELAEAHGVEFDDALVERHGQPQKTCAVCDQPYIELHDGTKQHGEFYDVDDRCVLHFHDWSVPPEEEVLATKLILEHREAWLRNEATVLFQDRTGSWIDLGIMRYKNPFGDAGDGRADAALTAAFGTAIQAALRGARPS